MGRPVNAKIDPIILGSVRINSLEKQRVILYTKDVQRCRDVLHHCGITLMAEIPFINGCYVELPGGMIPKLARNELIEYVAADIDVNTQLHIAKQCMGIKQCHQKGITGKGIGVAILDTGIYPHMDFLRPRNRIYSFTDLVNMRTDLYDDNGHGTFVAGVACGSGAASRGKFAGVAPEAGLHIVKTMDRHGNGSSSGVLKGMQWVADNAPRYGIKVLSLSLGSAAGFSAREDAMVRGVEELWRRGITVVAAAGNAGPAAATITTPGTSSLIITVGALNDMRTIDLADDSIAEFSSRGPVGRWIKPDIVAPGVDIVSAAAPHHEEQRTSATGSFTKKGYTIMSGTSVAAPMVAGMAALYLQQHPTWSPDQVKRTLMQNAHRLQGQYIAEGRGMALFQ